MIKESFTLRGVEFKNRVLVASGTFGYGNEVKELVDVNKLGGICTKSLSWKPRDGNPPRRIVETPSGMLNSIGLANVGVEYFIREKLPYLRTLDTVIIANIAASSIQEYCDVLSLLEQQEGIDGYEINVSCPNVREGGLEFGNDLNAVGRITEKVKAVTKKPIFIKLSPNVSRISDFAKVVKENGGDGVSAINTLVGTAFDIYTRKPKIKNVTGGLSGPAIKPVALAKILEIKRNVDIPIIGIGGIMNWKDAAEMMIVGASAFQIGTVNFINPNAGAEIVDGLKIYCEQNSINNISELTGTYQI